jgi:hypothetical protein
MARSRKEREREKAVRLMQITIRAELIIDDPSGIRPKPKKDEYFFIK